jgi:membrane associated rhomboid family serine protease
MLDDRLPLRSRMEPRWSAAVGIILLQIVVHTFQLASGWGGGGLVRSEWERWAALTADDLARGRVWQLVTFQFVHGSVLHLVVNCIGLFLFGRAVELALGAGGFLRLFLSSGVFGGALQAMCSAAWPEFFGTEPVAGASAGLMGVIGAFAALHWDQPITVFAHWMPVTLRGRCFALAAGVVATLFALERGSNLAGIAHLGGLGAGVAAMRLLLHAPLNLLHWRRRARRPATRPRELVRVPVVRPPPWRQAAAASAEELSPAEFIRREVDPILDKISAHGLHSLTERERQVLEQARRRIGET